MSKDIIFQSTQDNINEFIKDKDLDKLMELCIYIVTDVSLNRPPNELEKEFIKEFFTNDGWANHINNRKYSKDKFYTLRDKFDLPMISSILAFEIVKLSRDAHKSLTDKLTQKERVLQSVNELKVELENGLDNAVFGGVFDKVEGFSNIYEALIRHDMVKERED